jgi:DNA helicase-2/ATP-dependent DNA helicase PcrA
LTLLEASAKANQISKISARAAKGFQHFQQMIQECTQAADGGVGPLLELVVDRTGYRRGLLGSPSEQDRERLHNIDELIAAAYQYDETAGPEGSLEAFLETTALVNETDNLDAGDGRVTMMTLHAAKGLEFPVVFVVGVEDGLIPHERSKRDAEENSDRELEEERRLLFVGITRAKRRLYLTQSRVRALHGREAPTIISPFLQEFEHERVDLDDFRMPPGHEWVDEEPVILLDSHRGEETDTEESGESKRPMTTDLGARLFTAADLLSGTTGPAALPQGFAQGLQVRHPKYGTGTVIHVGGYGLRRTVTVRFQQDGREQDFVASKAPLQPIGLK